VNRRLPRPARLGLRARVTAAFALGSLLVTSVFALVTGSVVNRYLIERREAAGVREAASSARLVDDALRRDSERLADLVTGLAGESESTVLSSARTAGWLASGQVASAADVPADFLARVDGGAAVRQRLEVRGVPVLAVGLPLSAQDAEYVETSELRELDTTLRFISTMLLVGTGMSALLGGLAGQWLSRRALRPLTSLTDAAARFASGDLDARLPASSDPQLGPVTAAFNDTAESLKRRAVRDVRFAGDVSHELRSPITTMVNALAVLQRRRDQLPDGTRQAVDLLDTDLTRFRRMVDDLLEISRVDAGRAHLVRGPVDLAELVRAALAPRGAGGLVVVDEPPPWVEADRRRMERVVPTRLPGAPDPRSDYRTESDVRLSRDSRKTPVQ
jgi:HAMP domain-containing protein